jgi:hypothetical protein
MGAEKRAAPQSAEEDDCHLAMPNPESDSLLICARRSCDIGQLRIPTQDGQVLKLNFNKYRP